MNIEECKKDLYNELRIAADVDSDFLEDALLDAGYDGEADA